MTSNRSQLEISEKDKLNKIKFLLPKDCEIKYLPLTDQLLIYAESKDFDQDRAKKIGGMMGDYEIDMVKTGMWRWTQLLFINHFQGMTLSRDQNAVFTAIKTLITFAIQKEKDTRSSEISWAMHEAHFEGSEKEGKILAKELDKLMFEDSNKNIWDGRLIDIISKLKKEKKDEQRYQIYTTLDVLLDSFDFENKVTPGCAELLLDLLPQIDEQKINYSFMRNVNFTYPKDIKINLPASIEKKNESFIYKNNNFLTYFQNEPKADNSFIVAELNLSIAEFNEKYKGQYSIKKGEGLIWKGFWLIYNNHDEECGVLMPDGKELKETPHSKGTNNCIHVIKMLNTMESSLTPLTEPYQLH